MDRDKLRIPKSFDQLKDLNDLLKKYRDIYPVQIFVCFVVTYMLYVQPPLNQVFLTMADTSRSHSLQLFSLPGSMYLSILGGAVWGVARALPLCCACVATGSSLCYLLSSALGPALLTLPAIKTRMESFSAQVSRQRANIIPFLIVLRIAPLPPHWVVNMLCPHLGIKLPTFWVSTFLGIFGVTVIHTTIGSGLDDMTSAGDFHLISWRNFFLLAAVVCGALIPVGIRYFFAREVQAVGDVEDQATPIRLPGEDDALLAAGAPVDGSDGVSKKSPIIPVSPPPFVPGDSDSEFESDMDEDVILEAGPALVLKPEDEHAPVASTSSSPTPSSSRSSSSVP